MKNRALPYGWAILIFCLAACLLPMSQARAQTASYVWKNVTVGAGGFIPGIVFSRVEKGLIYLRSDMGGCYRWDDAQKTWLPLMDALSESSYMGGESIAPDPVDANAVYVAAGMYRSESAAMLRSNDRGKTWSIFPVPFKMGGNEDGRGVGERLAVDPNDTRILLFGSRHDGLMRSDNKAQNWNRVERFPLHGRGTPGNDQPTNTGLSFVVFDPHSGSRGVASKTIFVASADPGPHHLFRSDDGGETWQTVAGGPGSDMLPAKGDIDDSGHLYITYGNGTGPNGVTNGAVFVLDTRSGQWADITPDKRPDRSPGGYCGLSIDRQHPGTLAVTTMNHWRPIDTVWRTTDGGMTWNSIASQSQRDVSASPFLLWGKPQASLGWWLAALAIDPFDSDHVVYATGATVYATNDFSDVTRNAPTHWFPWIKGIEQTAIITLCSPTEGPHLLSGFGDIGGFVHEDIDHTPPQGMYDHPRFNTTRSIDYAGLRPGVIVRSGSPEGNEETIGFSEDAGTTWQPLVIPQRISTPAPIRRGRPLPGIIVSADGSKMVVLSNPPMLTIDRGNTWKAVDGLPAGSRPIADRVDPRIFYAMDFDDDRTFISTDGGESFQMQRTLGLPNTTLNDRPGWGGAPNPLSAEPGKRGNLWYVSKSGLFHSTDGGVTFASIRGDVNVEFLSFGKAPPGRDEPALFSIGTRHGVRAVWRSDDSGETWFRVNDEQHEWGRRFRCIAGDPRIFGRVYIGTDGRGVLYGDPIK